MIAADPIVPGAAALAEAKAYLRASGGSEDAVIERMLASALELAERFTGQALLVRGFVETVPAGAAWRRLGRRPVQAITKVEQLADGIATPVPSGSYSVDIDAGGSGWVRLLQPAQARLARVHYMAGIAGDWPSLPAPLVQEALRLTGHLFAHRGGQSEGEPPAAITALWRPYRQLRLA